MQKGSDKMTNKEQQTLSYIIKCVLETDSPIVSHVLTNYLDDS